MPEHLPRTPIHVFGESLRAQPLDHVPCEAILAGLGLLAACIAPLLFAGFLFYLLIMS